MEELSNIEKLVKSYRAPYSMNKDKVWEILEKKVDTGKSKIVLPLYRKQWFSIAASVVLILAVSIFASESFLFSGKYVTENFQQELILKDGTEVKLNPNSVLITKFSFFSGTRKLNLRGEALFNVTKGKEFSVRFPTGKIDVLGTVFRVNAYPGTEAEIQCITGKVKVSAGKNVEVIKSGAGIKIVDNLDFELIEVNERKVFDELNGKYNWDDKQLDEIFTMLENRFGYSVKAVDSIRSRKFTGSVNLANLETVCEVISFAMNLEFIINTDLKTITFEITD